MLGEKEQNDFVENEVEFVNYSFDLCFQQKSKTVKSYAMRLLENLNEKIDGILSFVGIGMIAIADAILSKRPLVELVNEFPTIQPIL